MKSLYILAALGISVNCEVSINVPGTRNSGTDGWYAGDCLSDLNSMYGYVNFDCGDNCLDTSSSGESSSG